MRATPLILDFTKLADFRFPTPPSTMVTTLLLAVLMVTAYADDTKMLYYHSIDDLGDSANLSCVPGGATNNTIVHWVLADNTILDLDTTGITRVSLSPDMNTLYIPSVEENLMGTYLCSMVTPAGDQVYSRTRLYLREDSLWEIYKKNVYIGLVAAGICLVLMGGLCILNNYRWSEDAKKKGSISEEVEIGPMEGKVTNGEVSPVDGYSNPGYEVQNSEAGAMYKEKGDIESEEWGRITQEEVDEREVDMRM